MGHAEAFPIALPLRPPSAYPLSDIVISLYHVPGGFSTVRGWGQSQC